MRQLLFIINLLLFIPSYGQYKVVFKILDESGEPLTGANIVIRGSSAGQVTDTEGLAYFGNLPEGKISFKISFVGFEEKETTLSFPEYNNETVEIELEPGQELEEIVIATTRSSRSIQDIPTRIEAVTGEELGEKAAMNSSNIGMLLRETTGVQMQQTHLVQVI